MTDVNDLIHKMFGNGDWTRDPAWLRVAHRSSAEALTRVNIDEATKQLARLFPPEVCRELMTTENGRRHIGGLFLNGWSVIEQGTNLLLGADLAVCDGWDNHPGLVADLRNLATFDDARLEIAIWAAESRAGLTVVRNVPPRRDMKSADFTIIERGVVIALEAKHLEPSRLKANLHSISEAIRGSRDREAGALRVLGQSLPNHKLRVQLSEELVHQAARTTCESFGLHVEEVANTFRRWYEERRGRLLGADEMLPSVAHVRVEPTDDDRNLWHFEMDPSEEDLARAIVRALAKAGDAPAQLRQHPLASLRLVCLWIRGRRLDAASWAQAMHAQILAAPEKNQWTRGLDCIVVLASRAYEEPPVQVAAIAMPSAPASIGEMTWLRALRDLRLTTPSPYRVLRP
jgi:hypothetical protein